MPGSGVTPPSSVPASQASFFLRRRRPAPALPLRLSPVLTLPPTCQSAEEERERKPCACLRVLPSATRRATPRHRCATPRVAVEDSRWWWMGRDWTGLDWTGRTLRLRRGVDLPGSIHSFRRPTRRARLRRPTPTTQYTPVEWQPCLGAEWEKTRHRASQGSGARSTFRVLAWTATDRRGMGGRPAAPPAGDRRTDDTSFLCRSLLTQRSGAGCVLDPGSTYVYVGVTVPIYTTHTRTHASCCARIVRAAAYLVHGLVYWYMVVGTSTSLV